MSPEYIYQIAPGAMFPDYQRYGVLWMNRDVMEVAYDMEEAFNEVSLTLARGADELLDPDRDILELDGRSQEVGADPLPAVSRPPEVERSNRNVSRGQM